MIEEQFELLLIVLLLWCLLGAFGSSDFWVRRNYPWAYLGLGQSVGFVWVVFF